MIYLDTSALVKLVFEEVESSALAEWLATKVEVPKISSDVSIIELNRTCRRVDESALAAANLLLAGIDLIPVDRSIVELAATVPSNELRSLDAVHLASAVSIKSHSMTFVAYDSRLCSAALQAGIAVESPR